MTEYVKGLVSVVIPTYNRAGMLPTSVASCLEQTYGQVEVLVVDDGSKDDTLAVLRGLEAKYGAERFRWTQQQNAGAPVARNTGMGMARGEFLQFLDSDDYLAPVKFEKQVEALRQCDADVAVCDYQCATDFSPSSVFRQYRNDGDLHLQLAGYGGLGSVFAPLIRRDRMPPELQWDPVIWFGDDPDFMFRLFLTVKEWCYTPGYWCTSVHHGGERISAEYPTAVPQHWELVMSAYRYWQAARYAIPPKNAWMVPHWVCHFLSQNVRYSRDRKVLRQFAGLAFRRPWNARVCRLCLELALRSVTPGWAFGVRSRLKGRTDGE